jgi:hypothetical protein
MKNHHGINAVGFIPCYVGCGIPPLRVLEEGPGAVLVQLRSSHNVAQTNATVYLHARILDGNGVPVKNEKVTFTNLSEPFGVIKTVLRALGLRSPRRVRSCETNNLGIATVRLTYDGRICDGQAEVNSAQGEDKGDLFRDIGAFISPLQ